jgi:CRISPR/Cas system endoribonuclease Cas6 (RAMP superfamily)
VKGGIGDVFVIASCLESIPAFVVSHYVHFSTHEQPGFVGTCTYQLRGLNDKATTTTPLTLLQQVYLLAQLAFYSGIGYKTAMGLGQARLRE